LRHRASESHPHAMVGREAMRAHCSQGHDVLYSGGQVEAYASGKQAYRLALLCTFAALLFGDVRESMLDVTSTTRPRRLVATRAFDLKAHCVRVLVLGKVA